jgi:carbon-monoxide dehydrogenase medium subunit
MYEFEYHRPNSLEEAVLLLKSGEDVRVLAGGMSLIPTMKHRLSAPTALIDLNALSNLRSIDFRDGLLQIGAMTLHETVADSPLVREKIAALTVLAGHIGDVQVRHRGTIGGSVCNNDPAACYPSAVLALDAKIQTTLRTISADDFFVGMFETALEQGEIVTRIDFPVPDAAAYIKFHNMASRFSIVGVFLAKFGSSVRVAVTGAGNHVFRERESEERLSRVFSTKAIADLSLSVDDLISDVHGTSEFRAHLIPVLLRQAVEQCLEEGRV